MHLTTVLGACVAALFATAGGLMAQSEKKFEEFDKVVKGAKEYEGLFRLHQKDERLYAEIRQDQFDKPMLCPIAIAQGIGMGGYTLNFDEQWVLVFRRVGDKVQVVRRNVHFKAKSGSPLARAVETTYADSVLLALQIHSIHPVRQSVLIDFNDIFMNDFAQLGLGRFDANRSTWHKVKTFPRNVELEVAATFDGGGTGGDAVIDGRGTTVVIHYGLTPLSQDGYQPRLADDRVGHFLSVVKDFSSEDRDTDFVRHVARWRLERAENDSKHKDKLSPPKKKIVFWIEKSVPDEYRAYVREGILEWNKAFEKIGFRDAIEVRQQENEDFDPEDINYNTFRWITTGQGFAMGPSRIDPMTGEILDADIIFDASMIRYWQQEFRTLARGGLAGEAGEEPASLIQAIRLGALGVGPRGFPSSLKGEWNDNPVSPDARMRRLREQLTASRQGVCVCGSCLKFELGLAALTAAARIPDKKDDAGKGDKDKDDTEKKDEKRKEAASLSEEILGQAIKYVTMHEVGHTLGLRHNFKASTMLTVEQLHDPAVTRARGLAGSVMDYLPINLAPKGTKQGDYFMTTLGTYDYWAIEYAYKPLTGGTDGEIESLREIAKRGANPGLDYGTDEDLFGTADPSINVWDLGADPARFGRDRIELAKELLDGLADRVVEKGEGYQRTRQAFAMLLGQFGNGAHLVVNHVGGEFNHRDHRGDPNGRDPVVPVSAESQRAALKYLADNVLTDASFRFSPELLRRLASDRWMHWGNEATFFRGTEFPVFERVLAIQRLVLSHLFDPQVMARMQNASLKVEKPEAALGLAEVFSAVSDAVWAGLDAEKPVKKAAKEKPSPLGGSIIRRNLQREHLKKLSALVLSQRSDFSPRTAPADARSLARLHLRRIANRITLTLADDSVSIDETTRAHLEECKERIAKVLGASMVVQEP